MGKTGKRTGAGLVRVILPVIGAGVAGLIASPVLALDLRDYGPSSLLAPGETEVRLWESYYTQTAYFDDDGERTDSGARSSWHTGMLWLSRGWRPAVEPGVELVLRSVDDGTFPDGEGTRTAVTQVTPSVQWAPLPRRPWLTFRTGVAIPTGDDYDGSDGRPFLDFGDWIVVQQVFADLTLSRRLQAYLETGGWLRFDRSQDDVQLTTPLKSVLNWHGGELWTLYLAADAAPDWVGDARGNFYSQLGVGGKLRPAASFELEGLVTTFPRGKNSGAGNAFNLGVRWVR